MSEPATPPAPTGSTPNPPPAGASPSAQPAPKPASSGGTPAPANGDGKPAAGTKSGSIYEAVGLEEPGSPGSTVWPTDWREQISEGIDPKLAKSFERFQSVKDLAKSWVAQRQLISSGEYKRAMPTSDSPEDLKAWREEQGIPDSPDGYELPQVQGVDMANLDETTKAGLDIIRTGLHKANLSRDQAATVSQAILELSTRQAEAQAEADAGHMDAVEDALRSEWGADYRRNLNMNGALLSQHFGDEMNAILTARMPDGMRLADHPGFNKFLNAMARANGSDVMFDGDVKGGTSIDQRLGQIKQIMETDFNRYLREGLDKEYGQLLEKKEARGGR